MSRATMTPGPWEMRIDPLAHECIVRTVDYHGKPGGGPTAKIEIVSLPTDSLPDDPFESNARAIAVLPELIEAARETLRSAIDMRPALETLRRILARIDGDSHA